jgi:hypothetical protein
MNIDHLKHYLLSFQAQHPVISNLAISVLTGLAASVAYQVIALIWSARRLRRKFASFSGEYDEFRRLPYSSPEATGVTIRMTYQGGAKFKTEAFTSTSQRFWRGEIFMREEVPVLGEGFYSHDGRDDTGIHRVLYNPEALHFNVSGANTSHPEGVKDFKTIWKRRSARK